MIADSHLVLFDGSSALVVGDTDSNEINWEPYNTSSVTNYKKTFYNEFGRLPLTYQKIRAYIVLTEAIADSASIAFALKGITSGTTWKTLYTTPVRAGSDIDVGYVFNVDYTPEHTFLKIKVTASLSGVNGGKIKGYLVVDPQTNVVVTA